MRTYEQIGTPRGTVYRLLEDGWIVDETPWLTVAMAFCLRLWSPADA